MTKAIVVMGVSGTGKSTLARALAETLGYRFVEGDDCHAPANIAKMAAGIALDDEDREPFLENVATALAGELGAVASCSALKRAYRDLLRGRRPGVRFVHPVLSREQLVGRMQARAGHFMPASLLDSQLRTLERPSPDEAVIEVAGDLPLEQQVSVVIAALSGRR